MGRMHLATCAAALLAGFAVNASAQELIVNGDTSSFAGTAPSQVPTGWSVTTPGFASQQSTTNSPFTNKFASNTSSWQITDEATTDVDGFRQTYSGTIIRTIAVNFDFLLGSLTNNPIGVQYDQANIASNAAFRLDTSEGGANNQFAINQGTNGGFKNVLTLTPGQWYNVQATLDDTAGTIDGTITPFGGNPTHITANLVNGHDGFNSVLVRDRTIPQSEVVTFDNFSVVAVPEPASLGAVCIGGLLLARRRRA